MSWNANLLEGECTTRCFEKFAAWMQRDENTIALQAQAIRRDQIFSVKNVCKKLRGFLTCILIMTLLFLWPFISTMRGASWLPYLN
jgi:hypothetical protein